MKRAQEKSSAKANLHGPFESFEVVWEMGGVSTLSALCVFVFFQIRFGDGMPNGVGRAAVFFSCAHFVIGGRAWELGVMALEGSAALWHESAESAESWLCVWAGDEGFFFGCDGGNGVRWLGVPKCAIGEDRA